MSDYGRNNVNARQPKGCHPEAPAVGPKDLQECFGLNYTIPALRPEFWVKIREKAIKPDALREILRQKKAQDDSASKVLLAPGAKRVQLENHTRN